MARKTVTSRFVLKGDNQLNSAFSKAQKQLGDLSRKAALFGAAAVAAGAAVVRSQSRQIDELAKTAEVVGVTVESLQALRFEAELNGIAALGMDDSLRRLQRRAGEFANSGAGPAAKAFELLGIEVRNSNGQVKDTDVLYREVIAAMEPIESVAQQSALAAQLFGDDFGPKLVPLLRQGVRGIDDARETLEDLGALISDTEAAGVERMNDAMSTARLVSDGLAQKFTVTLAPAITAIAEEFIDAAKEGDGFGDDASDAAKDVGSGLFTLVDAVASVGRGFKLAANGGIVGFESLKATLWSVADSIVNGPNRAVDGLLDRVDALPGISIDFRFGALAPQLRDDLAISERIIAEAQAEIDSLLLTPLPSEALRKRLAAVREELENAKSETGERGDDGGGLIVPQGEVKRIEQVQGALDSLMQQVTEFGADAGDKALLRLVDFGATEADITLARQMADELRLLQADEDARQQAAAERLDMEREAAGLLASSRTDIEAHAEQVQRVVDLYAAGAIPGLEEYERILVDINNKFSQSTEKVSELDEFGRQAARNMQSDFAGFLFDPLNEGFDGMVKGFGASIRRMAAEAAAASIFKKLFGGDEGFGQLLGGLFGGGGESSGGGGISSFLGGLFGGARADGGPVAAGVPYLVGERGPELVVPRQAAAVVPNRALARAPDQVTFNQQINLPPETSRRTAQQHAQQIGRETQLSMNRNR